MQEVASVNTALVGSKRVLVRVDYNVPIENGEILDDSRIKATLPTISVLRDRGASKIILLTHLGRPEGKVVEDLRTAQLLERLSKYTTTTDIEMLENLRFDPREESNDESLARELASRGDAYVNEAFSNSHRSHASMVLLPKLLPSFAGLAMLSEIENLTEALTPPSGAVALLAVTKPDKLQLAEKLATKYEKILLGGPVPENYSSTASNILAPIDGIPDRKNLFDIGPQTLTQYVDLLHDASFVLWNGPLGWYEKGYTTSTDAIAKALIANNTRAVIGGGNTLNAVKNYTFSNNVFFSTGGGAMVEFLTTGTLPAIEALNATK